MSRYSDDVQIQEQSDPLFNNARLGVEAEAFLESNLGKHLITRAEHEIETHYKALSETDPFDSARVAHLQNKIKVARAAIQWLAETINEGHVAAQTLIQQDFND